MAVRPPLRKPLRLLHGPFLVLVLWALAGPAEAHKPSDSYLRLQVDGERLSGRWDIALRDLHELVGLDGDGDGAITWAEVRAQQQSIREAALSALQVHAQPAADAGACPLRGGEFAVVQHVDGPYAALPLEGACASPPARLRIDYSLLFALDRSHRGLLKLDFRGGSGGTQGDVFHAGHRRAAFTVAGSGLGRLFGSYLHQGLWHIWKGFDHLLFLLCLLLPAVVWRGRDGWTSATDSRRAALHITGIITAFTAAHALSLSAAAVDWLRLPTRWVEAGVAATIVFAALNNLVPVVRRRLWLVAFGFGLIHGAGYAGVLAGLGLSLSALTVALLGFNLGVEGGQILVAALFMPLMWGLRRRSWYPHLIVVPGSLFAAGLGALWLAARVFHIRLEGLL